MENLKKWLVNNWFKVSIIVILLIGGFWYFSNDGRKENNELGQTQSQISNADEQKSISENLAFDVDVNSLSYALPRYELICTPEKKFSCSSQGGCQQVKANVFVLISFLEHKMYRCDNKPCDGYSIQTDESGEYMNIRPENSNGTIVKLEKGGNYYEVVSLGLDTLTSFGSCYSPNSKK